VSKIPGIALRVNLFLGLFWVLLFSSCRRNSQVVSQPQESDTTIVLNMAFERVLHGREIIDIEYVVNTPNNYYHPFGDTIMVVDHPVFRNYIPNIKGYQLKFLSADSLCKLQGERDIRKEMAIADALELREFLKRDSVYTVGFQVTGVWRWFDKQGKPYKDAMTGKLYAGKDTCAFSTGGTRTFKIIEFSGWFGFQDQQM
jgi:hypothetical protein